MKGAGDTLRRVVDALEAAGASYMVVGSLASTFHGVPRTTRDIDVVVEVGLRDLEAFVESLPEASWYADVGAAREAQAKRSMFNVIDLETGWKVDVIVRKESEFARSEFSRRVPAELLGVDVFVATAEDSILSKLVWARESGSERQLEDVRGIIESAGPKLDRGYVDRWAAELGVRELWQSVSR